MLRTVVVTGWVVVVTFVWWIHIVSLESIRSHKLGRLHIRLLLLSSSSSCGCYIASLYRLPRHWVSLSHLPLPVIHVADPIFSFSHTLSSGPGLLLLLLLPLSMQTTQQHKLLLLLRPLSMQTTQQHKLVKNSLL
jgi:hypothetical protein